jgi:LmbE family N-acetylglucosaminyl deacetylase
MSFRARLRPLKRALARPLELGWSPVIAAIDRSMRTRCESWSSPGRQQVLVVAPHPDDEAIGCAGTLLRHRACGDHTCIAIATDGRRSQAVPDADQMARLRHTEGQNAARLLQATRFEWLGLPEGDWQPAELAERLRALIADWGPTLVYAPSRVDFHPEHRAVAHALALALDAEPAITANAQVRVYQVQVPLTSLLINLYADVSEWSEISARALEAYASQAGSITSGERLKRYSALAHGKARHVESFWQMPAADYAALHRGAPRSWPDAFRGLRNFPLSDPLAWLSGNRERRRIAAAAPG